MGQYRQLLVLLTDVDPHSAALRRALALAQVSGAGVHVLGLFEPAEQHTLHQERVNETEIQRHYARFRERLEGLVERHRSEGIRSQAIDYIAELNPDLVIKDSEAGIFTSDIGVADAWVEEMRETLQAPFEALADAEGVPADRRHFVEGGPVQVIREQVLALDIDVVVMGVVQPKGLDKLLGDTTERLVSQPPCSVLAIHPCPIQTWEPLPCN